MHQIKIRRELRLLVAAVDHIRVGGDHLAPGHQARLDLVFNRGLVAGAVAGPLIEHLLLQLFAQGADRIGLLAGVDVAAEANGGVEVAVDVVGRQRLGVGPLVAGLLELTHIGPIRLTQGLLEDGLPVLHEQPQQHRQVLEIVGLGWQAVLPVAAEVVV